MLPRAHKSFAGLFALLSLAPAWGREKPDVWLEVRSPHFLVVTNGNEKQARHVAGQFEHVRAAFLVAFPNQRVDPSAPIIALAAKNEKTFDTLIPKEWLDKGALRRGGLFQAGPEKNYVLLRLDTQGENPFHVVYHEYTHLLTSQFPEPVPLWFDEGLAEFYGNSEIQEKQIQLGRVSEGALQLLRVSKLLPLETLFAVDHASPYYNENNKGSIFYAESWALVHMLTSESFGKTQNPLRDYFNLIEAKTDPAVAAKRAFGDLNELQRRLEAYVRGAQFKYFTAKVGAEVDEQAFSLREMSPAEVDAVQGDFLVYCANYEPARVLLHRALEEDPKSAPACESMGLLEFREKNLPEARNWFMKATELNSKSYLAYYYYATMRMRESPQSAQEDDVADSLRKAISINPQFAPALDALAQFYTMRGDNLEEAHRLALRAVELEPSNMYYYLTTANALLRMEKPEDALRACRRALGLAKTPSELGIAQSMLESAQKYQEYLDRAKRSSEESRAPLEPQGAASSDDSSGGGHSGPPVLRHRNESSPAEPPTSVDSQMAKPIDFQSDPAKRGERDMLTGTIEDVQCTLSAVMMMTFKSPSQTVKLFSDNYYAVEYSAMNFTPQGELHPCQDIKGMKAKVFFYDLKDKPNEGELISIQLRK